MTTALDVPTSKFKALSRLVGNTPLLSIHFHIHGVHRSTLSGLSAVRGFAGKDQSTFQQVFVKRIKRSHRMQVVDRHHAVCFLPRPSAQSRECGAPLRYVDKHRIYRQPDVLRE